jgi:hypothetical protein
MILKAIANPSNNAITFIKYATTIYLLPPNSNSFGRAKVFTIPAQCAFRGEYRCDDPFGCLGSGSAAFLRMGEEDTGGTLLKAFPALKRVGTPAMINANFYHLPELG